MSDMTSHLYPEIEKYHKEIDYPPLDFTTDKNPKEYEDIGINDIFLNDLGQLLNKKAKSVHFADD